MRRLSIPIGIALLAVGLLAGCGQKSANQASQGATSADSLLASNPTEQSTGNLTPQTDYQQPDQTQPPVTTVSTKPKTTSHPKTTTPTHTAAPAEAPGVLLAAGTPLKVAFSTHLTSETAVAGDAWSGTIKDPVMLGTEASIPAGSIVHGVVTASLPAAKGSRAMLLLNVTSLEIAGKSYDVSASTDSIIAGSPRARNVGAVAGGAAAGALLGRAIGGSGKGALIGGLIGGAAATGAVATTKGYQVEVKEGSELSFTVSQNTKLKL